MIAWCRTRIRRLGPSGLVLLSLLAGLLAACGGGGGGSDGSPTPTDSRSFVMGFTPFPHAGTQDAVDAAYAVIASDADLIAHHFDDGVPWEEALNNAASYRDTYDGAYLAELDSRLAASPRGHTVYIAATPLNFERAGLALHRGATGSEPLTPPWDGYALDHPNVIAAFGQHCLNLIEQFDPDYFGYAIEANNLAANVPAKWPEFVNLAQATYTTIKAAYPVLPVFLTLQADFFQADPPSQTAAINQVLPYTDLIAISSYPYTIDPDPRALPADHFSALADLAPDKPFAVAETAWPAEDVTDINNPATVLIPADAATQQAYIERLLTESEDLSAEFVTLFFTRDFDDFWDTTFQLLPEAALVRIWKDTGLYNGAGNPRAALGPWRDTLAKPVN
jgi:hypothetical protein